MATGNEILSYTGDKNLAFGSTALPSVSTDVVVDLTPGIKFWQDYANNKLLVAREREAQLARKRLLAQKDLQDKLDIGQYEILPQDKESFKIIWEEFRNDLRKGAAGGYLSGDPTNEDFNKIQNYIDKFTQFSKFSMQQKEDAKIQKTQIAQDPDKYENAGDIETWLNIGDPFERAKSMVQLKAKFDGFNAVPYKKEILETLQNDNINLKGEADRFNNVTYTVEGELKTNGVTEYAAATYDNDRKAQELAQYLISQDPIYYGIEPKAAFQKWSLDLAPESLQPIIRGINFAPSDIRNPQLPIQAQTNFPVNVTIADPDYTVVRITKDGKEVFKVKDSGGKDVALKDKSGKQISNSFSTLDAAEEALRASGGVVSGTIINAWLPTKTAEFPSNIPINPPQLAYDAHTNTQLTPNEIGTDAWTVDLSGGVQDWHRNKKTKALIFEEPYNTLSAEQKKNYEVVRLASVKKPNGATYLIPYNNNISVPLSNALQAAKVDFYLPPVDVNFSLQGESQPQTNQQPKQQSIPIGATYKSDENDVTWNGKEWIDNVDGTPRKNSSFWTDWYNKHPEQFKKQSGMIKVILNGQIGEIPADNWEAFKKKYPSATKQ